MGLTSDVARACGIRLECIGSLELVAYDDAARFLEGVAAMGLVVLGIEGFRVDGGRAIPEPDGIADFSAYGYADRAKQSIEDACRFVRQVGRQGVFFEFVLDEHGDSALMSA